MRPPRGAAGPTESETESDVSAYRYAHPRVGTLTLLQRVVSDRDASGLWVWSAGEALAQWLCTAEAARELDLKIGRASCRERV